MKNIFICFALLFHLALTAQVTSIKSGIGAGENCIVLLSGNDVLTLNVVFGENAQKGEIVTINLDGQYEVQWEIFYKETKTSGVTKLSVVCFTTPNMFKKGSTFFAYLKFRKLKA